MGFPFGVILPHFNRRTSGAELVNCVTMAEELGFSSAWTRDHVFISEERRVHGGIAESGFITESLMTLAAMSSVTSEIRLGTAVLTPHRHPVKVAQLLGTLSHLSNGRVICGIGAGNDPVEFRGIDVPFDERLSRVEDTIQICRACWSGDHSKYQGDRFSLDGVSIDPSAVPPVPFWYGGLTFAAVERAVAWADGWLPSRVPFPRLKARIERCQELVAAAGKKDFVIGAIPQIAIGNTEAEALAKFDPAKVAEEAARLMGEGARVADAEALKGMILWGTPKQICGYVEEFVNLGVNHLVFDLRTSFEDFEPTMRILSKEVISQFS